VRRLVHLEELGRRRRPALDFANALTLAYSSIFVLVFA
jgi:hypothetical protein